MLHPGYSSRAPVHTFIPSRPFNSTLVLPKEMDPTGPSQPNLDTAYEHPSNPAQSSSEQADSNKAGASLQRSDPKTERRKPNDAIKQGGNDQSEAMPSSLGYGAQDSSGDAGDSVRVFSTFTPGFCLGVDEC